MPPVTTPLLDWHQIALPLVIAANGLSVASLLYSRFTRKKIDALIDLMSKHCAVIPLLPIIVIKKK